MGVRSLQMTCSPGLRPNEALHRTRRDRCTSEGGRGERAPLHRWWGAPVNAKMFGRPRHAVVLP